ncbi:CapA family protein [Pantoea ananatis]|uniref:CapA family protein n=1 Tax=Pantoea ananas TaxID=553 RepID=UPI0018901057|nr:CapA family protein [Pantoea ananatis]
MFKLDKEQLDQLKQYIHESEDEIKAALETIIKGGWEAAKPILSQRSVQRGLILLLSQIFYDEFHYPQPQVGRYDVANNNFEKLKWVYRYWLNQLEVAEKGSDIAEYFRQQELTFPLPEGFKETNRMKLSSGGDLLAVDVLTPENIPDLFTDVKDFYFSAGLICANLETTIDKNQPFGRNQCTGEAARMNTSEEVFQIFYDQGKGINFYSTANNHSYDYGKEGLQETLNVLDKYRVYHAGTNRTEEERNAPLVIEKNGIKVAMLSYTMDLNGHEPAPEDAFRVNEVRFNDEVCDFTFVRQQVARVKEMGADIIIACCHWGWEFELYPHKNVIEAGHELLEMGIDVILGNHPHVAQPMERYTYQRDGVERSGLISYSCGDFVAYHPESRDSRISYIIKFDIVKGKLHDEDATFITDLKMLPVYMLNEQIEGEKFNCRMLKFSHVLADTGENGTYTYGLTALEREQLPHVNEVVLHKILLPENHEGLLVEE